MRWLIQFDSEPDRGLTPCSGYSARTGLPLTSQKIEVFLTKTSQPPA